MIRRIAALLVALAVLAERVAARSWPVRCFVLWLFRRVEPVVADYVFDVTGIPPTIEGFAVVGNSPDDAMLLAARFRVLAAALRTLLGPDAPFLRQSASAGGALGRLALCCGGLAAIRGGWTPEPIDTS